MKNEDVFANRSLTSFSFDSKRYTFYQPEGRVHQEGRLCVKH